MSLMTVTIAAFVDLLVHFHGNVVGDCVPIPSLILLIVGHVEIGALLELLVSMVCVDRLHHHHRHLLLLL